MEIITRAEALGSNKSQYFTGLACVQGHVAVRYTSSGTCSACLNESNRGIRDKLANPRITAREEKRCVAIEATRLKEEKSAAVAQLVEQRLRVEYTDWPVIRATAIALCRSRYPILSDADAISHKGPVSNAGGTAVYRVLVPPNSEDMRMMLDVAEVLLNSHPADTSLITARRDEYLRSLETPPAEWAQKP